MRTDMKYIVLDKPRQNHDFRICKGERKKSQGNPDTLPLRQSMKSRWHFHCRRKGTRLVGREDHRKDFSDHLAPLIRFLASHLGDDWQAVHSEIREQANYRSVLGFHLLYHFGRLVRCNVHIYDGIVFSNRGAMLMPGEFYVDPHTNMLNQV